MLVHFTLEPYQQKFGIQSEALARDPRLSALSGPDPSFTFGSVTGFASQRAQALSAFGSRLQRYLCSWRIVLSRLCMPEEIKACKGRERAVKGGPPATQQHSKYVL